VMVLIRNRQPEIDDRLIHKLIKQELIPHTKREFPDVSYDPIESELRLWSGITYVITKRKINQPLGFITTFIEQGYLYIDMLAVDDSCQGKGLGSRLIDHVEQRAKKTGCTESRLMVEQGNQDAKVFYFKKGYVQIQYIPEQRCFLLGKTL
jgi:ribosomal protein S18 acetylase RimI-like enzyme